MKYSQYLEIIRNQELRKMPEPRLEKLKQDKKERKKFRDVKPQILSKPAYMPIGRNTVILCDDLVFENEKYFIRVKKNFITDGGSLPRLSWSLLGITPFDPRCVYAFFLHDFLYQSESLARAENDTILSEALKIPPSCNAFQNWLIWSHVRAYGWMVYKSHTPATIEQGRKAGEIATKKKLKLETVIQ